MTAKTTLYFYANIDGHNHPQAYVFAGFEDQHCQLHGEFVRRNIKGHRIKVSGRVSNVTHILSLDQLTPESRTEYSSVNDSPEKGGE